jgi:PPOX class probable F420-dependent enzyme
MADPVAPVAMPERALPLLAGCPIAFMTTMRPDGRMSTNPVALLFEDGVIRISTTSNRKKYRNLMADDRVTICVVQPDNLNKYVEIRGRATVEMDTDRVFITRLTRHYGIEDYTYDRPQDVRVIVTVIPERISSPWIPYQDKPPYMDRPAAK